MLEQDTKGRVSYVIFVCLGIAMLLAYNSFISSPHYVNNFYKYAANNPNATTSNEGLWEQMETLVAVVSLGPNFMMQTFALTPVAQRLPLQGKVLASMTLLLLAVVVVAVLPLFEPDETGAMVGLIVSASVAGGATSLFQSAIFGLGSMLPASFVQAIMLGVGLSGSVTSFMRIMIKVAVGEPSFEGERRQANFFFGLAASWLVLCLCLVVLLPKIFFLRVRIPAYGGSLSYDRDEFPSDPIAIADTLFEQNLIANVAGGSHTTTPVQYTTSPSQLSDKEAGLSPVALACDARVGQPSVVHTVRVIWPYMLANFLVYCVSLIIFPQLCSRASHGEYYAVLVIFLFNAGDTLARFLCRFSVVHVPSKALLPISVIRMGFIAVIVLCVHPKVLPGAVIPAVVMFIVGLTNGHASSLCMMYAPASLDLPDHERSIAGAAMSLSLLGGASGGSLIALPVNAAL